LRDFIERESGLREYSPCVDGGRISDVVHGRFPRMKPRVKFVIVHPQLLKRGVAIRGRAHMICRLPHFAYISRFLLLDRRL